MIIVGTCFDFAHLISSLHSPSLAFTLPPFIENVYAHSSLRHVQLYKDWCRPIHVNVAFFVPYIKNLSALVHDYIFSCT